MFINNYLDIDEDKIISSVWRYCCIYFTCYQWMANV